MARELDHRRLHTHAYAEIRDLVFPAIFRRRDHALDASRAEAAGDDHARIAAQTLADIAPVERLRIFPAYLRLQAVRKPAVTQRFRHGKIGVVKLHIFANKRDFHDPARRFYALDHIFPFFPLLPA